MKLVFYDPSDKGRKTPEHHLADVEIVFDQAEGPLAGLKLVGSAVWGRADGEEGISVTLPSRKVEGVGKGGKEWFYELLRADDNDGERIKKLKSHIVVAYREHVASQVVSA